MEYLTGGEVQAGFHEVVVNESTRAVIDQRRASGEGLWRVSSTLFSHIASDQLLEPIGAFRNPDACAKYPSTPAGQQVALDSS